MITKRTFETEGLSSKRATERQAKAKVQSQYCEHIIFFIYHLHNSEKRWCISVTMTNQILLKENTYIYICITKTIPLCFSQTLDKKERKTMIRATPAMSPISIASVFSISSSLWLLSSTLFKLIKKIKHLMLILNV